MLKFSFVLKGSVLRKFVRKTFDRQLMGMTERERVGEHHHCLCKCKCLMEKPVGAGVKSRICLMVKILSVFCTQSE